jgi:hypothetical protein
LSWVSFRRFLRDDSVTAMSLAALRALRGVRLVTGCSLGRASHLASVCTSPTHRAVPSAHFDIMSNTISISCCLGDRWSLRTHPCARGVDIHRNIGSSAELKSLLYGVHPRDWEAPTEIYPSVVDREASVSGLPTLDRVSSLVWFQGYHILRMTTYPLPRKIFNYHPKEEEIEVDHRGDGWINSPK